MDAMSRPTIEISIAGQDDIPVVVALVAELLAELGEEGREFAALDRTGLAADVGAGIASGRFVALLARGSGGGSDPIGVLTLAEAFAIYAGGRYGIIDEMYVRPDSRDRGIGKALLEGAASLARERGWSRLEVTAPEDDPAGAAACFYERRGFRSSGTKLRKMLEPGSPS
jgi:GNAT superfamily N-acetyltransferase